MIMLTDMCYLPLTKSLLFFKITYYQLSFLAYVKQVHLPEVNAYLPCCTAISF